MFYYLLSFVTGALLAGVIAWQLNLILVRRHKRHHRSLLLRARRAEKMAQLSDLTGNLAHEIRNPLSIIKVNLQLLSEDISYMLKDLFVVTKTCSLYTRIPLASENQLFHS